MGISISHAPRQQQFEARDEGGELAGFITYETNGDVIAFVHSEVKDEFSGHGVGSQLARAVMDDARSRGRRVVPVCAFLSKWLTKHPEYDDMVDRPV